MSISRSIGVTACHPHQRKALVKGALAPENKSKTTGGWSAEGTAWETVSNMARMEVKVDGNSLEAGYGATADGGPPIFHSARCLLLHLFPLCWKLPQTRPAFSRWPHRCCPASQERPETRHRPDWKRLQRTVPSRSWFTMFLPTESATVGLGWSSRCTPGLWRSRLMLGYHPNSFPFSHDLFDDAAQGRSCLSAQAMCPLSPLLRIQTDKVLETSGWRQGGIKLLGTQLVLHQKVPRDSHKQCAIIPQRLWGSWCKWMGCRPQPQPKP